MVIKKKNGRNVPLMKDVRYSFFHKILSYVGIVMAILAFFAVLYAVNTPQDIRSQAADTSSIGTSCGRGFPQCKNGCVCRLGDTDGGRLPYSGNNKGICRAFKTKITACKTTANCDSGYRCQKSLFSRTGKCVESCR